MRWFISIRYFLSHKRQSAVCIAGVLISVMMFIAMSAMSASLNSAQFSQGDGDDGDGLVASGRLRAKARPPSNRGR